MDEQACPRCKTTKYRNPSLKLLVNVCGHSLCDNCVELLFVKGSGSCPVCNIPLRRSNFRTQLFEDATVEKEVDIRKRILKDFNKKEEDFATLYEYNNYLEEIESIIYNLTNNVQVEATKQMIEQYKKDNKTLIQKNKFKLSKEEEMLEELIEQETMDNAQRKQQILHEEKEEKKMKIKQKENLIDELMCSDVPASHIMASHASVQKETEKSVKSASLFSQSIKYRQHDSFLPLPKDENPVYNHQEIKLDLLGPQIPDYDSLVKLGYLKHIRAASDAEKGGGYVSDLACYRALQEAMSGLFCSNDS